MGTSRLPSNRRANLRSSKGFTIIEIIVVVVVVGILVGVTIVGFGAWRKSTLNAQVKSDLNSVAAAMEVARSSANEYPNPDLPDAYQATTGVVLTPYLADASSTTYCIDGTSVDDATVQFYIASDTKEKGPQPGTCAARTPSSAPSTPTSVAVASTASDQITLTWTASPTATSYTLQCATDGAYIIDVKTATASSSPGTVTGLSTALNYNCRVRAVNAFGAGQWSPSVTATTVIAFGTVAQASGLSENSATGTGANFSWNSITCSLGTPLYRFVWVSPATSATSWSSVLNVNQTYSQATLNTWKVETKCTYLGVDSAVSPTPDRSFTSIVDAPSGSYGTLGWNGRFDFSAPSSTLACTSPASLEYRLVRTALNGVSSTVETAWGSSAAISLTGINQGSQFTTYFESRCLVSGTPSAVVSTAPRTDVASIDAPGSVPGWCAGTCGSPKGDRWSAVACPTGTTASYWAYAVGDYSNPIWGAYEATGFFGYNRPVYSYGNTMVNGYLMARCITAYTQSAYGPQGYARY